MDRENIVDRVRNIVGIDDISLDRVIFDNDRVIIYFFSCGIFYKVVVFYEGVDNKIILVNCCNNVIYCYIYNFNCYF